MKEGVDVDNDLKSQLEGMQRARELNQITSWKLRYEMAKIRRYSANKQQKRELNRDLSRFCEHMMIVW